MRVAEPMPVSVLGHVEIGLVEAQRFDMRGVVAEDRADLPADLAVVVEAVAHEDQVRAQPLARVTDGMAERTPNLRAS